MDEQSERVKDLEKHRWLKHIRIKSDIHIGNLSFRFTSTLHHHTQRSKAEKAQWKETHK